MFTAKDFKVQKNSLGHYVIDAGLPGCIVYTQTIKTYGGELKHYLNVIFCDPKVGNFNNNTPQMKGLVEISPDFTASSIKKIAAQSLNEFFLGSKVSRGRVFELIFEEGI